MQPSSLWAQQATEDAIRTMPAATSVFIFPLFLRTLAPLRAVPSPLAASGVTCVRRCALELQRLSMAESLLNLVAQYRVALGLCHALQRRTNLVQAIRHG